MRTFNDYVKEYFLSSFIQGGTLAEQINEQIKWAWNNWDIDFSDYIDHQEKPEYPTDTFVSEWIENEPFEHEIEMFRQRYDELTWYNIDAFLSKIV